MIVFKIFGNINIRIRRCIQCRHYMDTKTDWKNGGVTVVRVVAYVSACDLGDSTGESLRANTGKIAGDILLVNMRIFQWAGPGDSPH